MKWSDLFGSSAVSQDFTEVTLNGFFDEVEQDPRAGLGNLTKRALLIDKIMSQHRIVVAQMRGITPQKPPAALSDRPLEVQAPLDLKAASIAKRGGL